MKPFLFAALLAASATAADLTVEAVVLEMPNKAADALVAKGRRGETEPWKSIVSPDGESLDEKSAKVIARFEAKDFQDGTAKESLAQDEGTGRETLYVYRVDAKAAAGSRRYASIVLRVKGERAVPLKTWSLDLGAPLTAEWSFSARHRAKDVSRVVLEKSAVLSEAEKGDSKWTALRLLERDRAVGKRETEIDATAFADDPNEFYRVEWRHREGEVTLSQRDKQSLRQGKSVIDVGGESGGDFFQTGEDSHITRSLRGLMWSVRSERGAGGSGSKIRMLTTSYSRLASEPDLAPLAVQRPVKQSLTTWKDNLGEGKEQSSRVHVQLIAE